MGIDNMEIQEQIKFKMNQFLESLENRIANQWNIVFLSGSQKEEYYRLALLDIKKAFKKEIDMSTPYDSVLNEKAHIMHKEACKNIMQTIGASKMTTNEQLRIEKRVSIEIDKIINSLFNMNLE